MSLFWQNTKDNKNSNTGCVSSAPPRYVENKGNLDHRMVKLYRISMASHVWRWNVTRLLTEERITYSLNYAGAGRQRKEAALWKVGLDWYSDESSPSISSLADVLKVCWRPNLRILTTAEDRKLDSDLLKSKWYPWLRFFSFLDESTESLSLPRLHSPSQLSKLHLLSKTKW